MLNGIQNRQSKSVPAVPGAAMPVLFVWQLLDLSRLGLRLASSNNDPRQPVNAELNLMKRRLSSEMLRITPLVPYFNSSSDSPDFLMNALLFLSGTSFQIPSFSKWLFLIKYFAQVRLLFQETNNCVLILETVWNDTQENGDPRESGKKNRMAKYDRLWDFLWIKMSQSCCLFPRIVVLVAPSHYIWILHYSGIPGTFWKTFLIGSKFLCKLEE